MSFGFKSIEHALATVARDIAKGTAFILKEAAITEPVVEGITALLDPPAVVVERAAYSALASILGAVNKANTDATGAVTAKGLNVSLDVEAVADFKAVFALCQQELIALGVIKATTPTPPATGQ